MVQFRIDTVLRKSAFLAQILHESMGLTRMREIASGRAYTHRVNLGNTQKEAVEAALAKGQEVGPFYKGGGPMQITGFKNYKLCGQALQLDLVNIPSLLMHPEEGCKSAAWFWRIGAGLNLGSNMQKVTYKIPDGCDLNDYADNSMFEHITVAINGGLNGKEDRIQFYARALKVLK